MDLYEIRQALKKTSIYNIPLRVTFYARVSTDSEDQENSLKNQMDYYTDFIQSIEPWTFVPGYIDEGITGASTKKRNEFKRMVNDGTKGLFDLIITKEISRFARNTLDSIQFTRLFLSKNIGVFFQNDNILTFDEDSELRLAIMSSIAQDELRKLSSRVKFGHQQAIKNNVVLGNSRIYGYKKDDGRLIIDEDEAPMIQEIFALYSTDRYSMKEIERILWDKGYRNHNGKMIMHTTLSSIISNPKYKGYYVGNKVKIVDMFTRKQKFLPPEEWKIFKDETGEIVPAIVSEEVWDAANRILRRRSEDVKSHQGVCNHENIFTGKLFCSRCKAPYYRRDGKDPKGNPCGKWVCSYKIKNGRDSCPSIVIYESELQDILANLFKEHSNVIEAALNRYMKLYEEATKSENLESKISNLEAQRERNKKKRDTLVELYMDGTISKKYFSEMVEKAEHDDVGLEQELRRLQNQQTRINEQRNGVNEIRTFLRKAVSEADGGVIDRAFVNTFIDRIEATPVDKTKINLEVRLMTGGRLNLDILSHQRSKRALQDKSSTSFYPYNLFTYVRRTRIHSNYRLDISYQAALTL